MTAHRDARVTFDTNMQAATQLLDMYLELRRSRQLGSRGKLDAANQDLLWLPRSSVVASIGALDTYMHDLLRAHLHIAFERLPHAPDGLVAELVPLLKIANSADLRRVALVLTSENPAQSLQEHFEYSWLNSKTLQSPEQISRAFALLGIPDVFEWIASSWPGPNSTAADIRRRLAGYVRRRNQIAHEGDLERDGSPRPMQPQYADDCLRFISQLADRISGLPIDLQLRLSTGRRAREAH